MGFPRQTTAPKDVLVRLGVASLVLLRSRLPGRWACFPSFGWIVRLAEHLDGPDGVSQFGFELFATIF
jgi:hypothetical protein